MNALDLLVTLLRGAYRAGLVSLFGTLNFLNVVAASSIAGLLVHPH